uniref:thioredoxin family protein n=1 Tax=Stieleria sp. TaxID=2795976 RepID=UPI003568E443
RVLNGVTLQAERPSRTVTFTLQHAGKRVAKANVRVRLDSGVELSAVADDDGVAEFTLLSHETISAVTAWSQNERIGGYQFSRKPMRDPTADSHTIELFQCRPCPIVVKDIDGQPLSGVQLELNVATAPPEYNFIGTPDDVHLVTDDQGVAVYPYFPQIDAPYTYVDLHDEDWRRVEGTFEDDRFVLTVKKSVDRATVNGRVSGDDVFPGGFDVRLGTFQAEEEGRLEYVYAITDPDGSFSVDVLPDATYCVFVNDEQWVTPTIDLIPSQSDSQNQNALALNLIKGIPVRVRLTAGRDATPMQDVRVLFRSRHQFSWQENGEKRSGSLGPNSDGNTDDQGMVRMLVPPGELEVNAMSSDWRANQEIVVKPDAPNEIHLHRELDKAVAVRGTIVPWSDAVELKYASVQIGAIDGQSGDGFSVKTDSDGRFEFETKATKLAAVAFSDDKQFAGSVVIKDLEQPVQIQLYPTKSFRGQILDGQGQPVVSHPVRASIRVSDGTVFGSGFPTTFFLPSIERVTDQQGRYRFDALPCKTEILVSTDPLDHAPNQFRSIDTIYLLPDDEREEVVTRLGATESATEQKTMAERFQITQRDCRLGNFRQMVILADHDDPTVKAFIDDALLDYSRQQKITSFMQLHVTPDDLDDPRNRKFAEQMKWPSVSEGAVFVCVYDVNGKELARSLFDADDDQSVSSADEMIEQHAPDQQDAKLKWDKAFKSASETDRRVWIRTGQRYCGPCFRLSRWIDDHREVLEKDFVLVKIDDVRDRHGSEVAALLTLGRRVGVPFHAIFDAEGERITDSYGPIGNIGFMSGVEGKRHFREMLQAACRNITPDEIQTLIQSLDD